MNEISIEKLINAGAHFGHPTSRWNPRFENYISMKKNGVHIIDMEKTSKCMLKAAVAMEKIIKSGGNILFVGTKKQAKDVVQESADRCGMYYIVERWLGGTLTNYGTIKKSIKRLTVLEKESSSIYSNLTKKELNSLERERLRLADLHRGIKDMKHLPAALFFVDGIHEKIAIAEARVLGIPTFGIIDSNTDPSNIDFPIPANDDSMKTIGLIINYFADMIIDVLGKNNEFESSNDDIENETLDQSSDDEVEGSKTAIVEDVEDDMENNLEEKK
ncbi:MAG: 30S ribosomal protein S2 [Candidatus Neomarinimicrobiota bacterium]|nr:30S ribosomal protein S2 [Candidatus Neomarinimicrobiota bacterium]